MRKLLSDVSIQTVFVIRLLLLGGFKGILVVIDQLLTRLHTADEVVFDIGNGSHGIRDSYLTRLQNSAEVDSDVSSHGNQ